MPCPKPRAIQYQKRTQSGSTVPKKSTSKKKTTRRKASKRSHPRNSDEQICIRGAREHNLKNVDLDIPRDKLTVITGVSGSGKSSLAFDTLFAEGQRQYIDSLSAYARQFLDQIPRPDVDSIDGLAPTLAIDQMPGSTHGRSTVATISEIYDYLRLLYARIGTPHCAQCGSAISRQSSEAIIDQLSSLKDGSKLIVMAPMVRGRRGSHRDILDSVRVAGLLRVRVDGIDYTLDEVPELAPRKNHTIEAVVDRLVVRHSDDTRLRESVMLAIRLGDGLLTASTQDEKGIWNDSLYSTAMACVDCGSSFAEIEPRTFSFNSPYGACSVCEGLGYVVSDDAQRNACPECDGGRLCKEALSVTIDDNSICDLVAMPLTDAGQWMKNLYKKLTAIPKANRGPNYNGS